MDLVLHLTVEKMLGLGKKRVDSMKMSNYYYMAGSVVRRIATKVPRLATEADLMVVRNSRVHLPMHKHLS